MKHQSAYNRLRRIEGQIRGIEEMIAKEKSETELIIQLEAAKSSLGSTISLIVEEMFQNKKEGDVTVLRSKDMETLLRLIKKS